MGNTCFINSFTQLFFAARHFRIDLLREKLPRLLSSLDDSGTGSKTVWEWVGGRRVAAGFVLLMLQMHWMVTHGLSGRAVDTKYYRYFLPEPFNDGFQHDASEYGKVLMELLDNSCAGETARDGTSCALEEDTPSQSAEEKEEKGEKVKEGTVLEEGAGRWGLTTGHLPATVSTHTEGNTTETKSGGHGDISGGGTTQSTVVARWFGGVSASLIECVSCNHTRTQLSPFWDISVPLRREEDVKSWSDSAEVVCDEEKHLKEEAHVLRSADGHVVAITTYCTYDADVDGDVNDTALPKEAEEARQQPSLQDLLDSVLDYRNSGEVLYGDNMTYCESCRSREPVRLRTAVHTMCKRRVPLTGDHGWRVQHEQLQESDIAGVPFYLTLQLNRFHYRRETGSHEKVMDKVTINKLIGVPVRVVMRGSGCADRAEHPGEAAAVGNEEEDVLHGRIHYRLLAVLVHSGPSPRSGHYFTILRFFADADADAEGEDENDGTRDSWVLANDSMISPLTSETAENVLSGSSGVFGMSETPYIILYERCGYPPPANEALELPTAVEELLRSLVLPGAHGSPASVNNNNGDGGDGDDGDDDGAVGGGDNGADAFDANNPFWGGGTPIF
ncbi:ubiquitin hydrolase [Trypanosoma rangeli]|uniref:Ubiquitin hydrolase n=1 Tax=Trypanosoma rangeli TaxID=5698 RepID=A0A422NUE5_TRYRA|nr:ubiquitin hydrolase [Trypanosoma rangeli]RNF09082.1 ubiquitin hydrolase [Trypanosoma rangeli]|eukprot:RNF09082.1 ubiquitin hydrolase [Trypanosoma rangeli]